MIKIEVVIGKRFFDDLIALMNKNSIYNYSVLEILKSHGEEQGDSFDYGFLSVNKNFLLICVCDEEQFANFKKNIRPYLQDINGFICASKVERLD